MALMSVVASAVSGCSAEQSEGPRGKDGVDLDNRGTSSHPPKLSDESPWHVTRVVDGDTLEVRRARQELTVRLIGIDTPETVHPTEPVECFGPEASAYARRTLLGEAVSLEFDGSQGRRDYYGRTLAYVWIVGSSPRMFNVMALGRGYALEYTYDNAYRWQARFRRAEERARSLDRGVWSCPAPGS